MKQEEITIEEMISRGHNIKQKYGKTTGGLYICSNCNWEFFTFTHSTFFNNIGYELEIPTCKQVIMKKALE